MKEIIAKILGENCFFGKKIEIFSEVNRFFLISRYVCIQAYILLSIKIKKHIVSETLVIFVSYI